MLVEPVHVNGVPAEWTMMPDADRSRVLLCGGGYISGSIASHRAMVAEAGRQGGVRTLALGYRLAPEHPYPEVAAGRRALAAAGRFIREMTR